MDSLFDLLKDKEFDQPPEIAAIKEYVRKKYHSDVNVSIRNKDILLSVQSASLASSLRFDMQNLKQAVKTEKRISLRISS